MTTVAISAIVFVLAVAIIVLGVWIDVGIRVKAWAFPENGNFIFSAVSVVLWPIVLMIASARMLAKYFAREFNKAIERRSRGV